MVCVSKLKFGIKRMTNFEKLCYILIIVIVLESGM